MNKIDERWLDISLRPERYAVSNYGRVMSKPLGRVLCLQKGTTGYLFIDLSIEGRTKRRSVHSLVMAAFVGARPPKYDINHLDGNKKNNHVGNLEYCTRSQNQLHAVRNGIYTPVRGERNHTAKLTEDAVRAIRDAHGSGVSGTRLARAYGVAHHTIYALLNRRTWRHVA